MGNTLKSGISGNLDAVRYFVSDPNFYFEDYDLALTNSIIYRNYDITVFLLESGTYVPNLDGLKRLLKVILGIEALPEDKEGIINMLKILDIHRE